MRNLTPTAFLAPVAQAPQRTFLGDRLANRYLLLEPLGKGAASRVFLSKDERTNAQVAVKVLPPYGSSPFATPERFSAELAVGCGVAHANVARILDVGTSTWGEPFMVTEALVGETLGDRLHEVSKLPFEQALTLVREAARGLEAIHRAGYVHRDVKPDNLFLCDEERHGVRVKVIDFGFCKHLEPDDREERKVLGTLEYMAPEQAVAEATDVRADVYGLGVVLFRAVTGELPFDACENRGILSHHLISPVPPPSWLVSDVHPALDTLVLSATRKHPDNRYPTMAAFREDLDRALAGQPVVGQPLSVTPDAYQPNTEKGRLAFETLSEEL
ncbi:MAG TPA: serine/threonine-protein kinase [Polyangiaceae bacterium]|nr:serine/threonine-protein kinase [Polyangiaceae bacterium]